MLHYFLMQHTQEIGINRFGDYTLSRLTQDRGKVLSSFV
jgi:hypothetical protein